jgi:hypothetical protein
MALMGKSMKRATTSQNNAMNMPVIATAGISRNWVRYGHHNFAKCGAARPMNAMGPQKAVITAVNKPEQKIKTLETPLGDTDIETAMRSPKEKTSIDL